MRLSPNFVLGLWTGASIWPGTVSAQTVNDRACTSTQLAAAAVETEMDAQEAILYVRPSWCTALASLYGVGITMDVPQYYVDADFFGACISISGFLLLFKDNKVCEFTPLPH
jgi:hypothetical protein